MVLGRERLAGIFNIDIGPTTEPAINSPMDRCVGCPFAGRCTPCKPTAVKSEGSSLESISPITTVIRRFVSNNVINEGTTIIFRPTGTEVVGPKPPEKTCSQCGKNPNTCHCEESFKAA